MTDDLGALLQRMQKATEAFPAEQRALHEKLAEWLQREVRDSIHGTINDARGRISGYQGKYVGSRGGYAAVRPISGGRGTDSPGAITNYLENGHRIRRPRGLSRRYKPRIRRAYVDGRHFYRLSKQSAARELERAAERLAQDTARKLRG